MSGRRPPRVAIVSDPLVQRGGAEKVVADVLGRIFPDAPIHALLYSPRTGPAHIAHRVIPSALQRIPWATRRHRWLLPLYPAAVESIDLRGYDLIISSHHTAAKGILRTSEQRHICYCHTPMRALWERSFEELEELPAMLRPLAAGVLSRLREWDYMTAGRVDLFLANSETTRKRILRHYGRESRVVHPPLDARRFSTNGNGSVGDYYLVASRLVPYKRVDLAIAATGKLKRRLIVAGTGPQKAKLDESHVEYLGHVSDERLAELMRHARALLFPAFDDYGMTPVEMMACGRPVIAYARGGALETVVDGKTGVFAAEQTVDAFVDAIERFENAPIRLGDGGRARAIVFVRAVRGAVARRDRGSLLNRLVPLGHDSQHRRGGTPRFYFFLVPPGRGADTSRYQHPVIALAEGFAELGIPFAANIDHWPATPHAAPLFRADPAVDPRACTAVIFASDWFEEGLPLPPGPFSGPDRPMTVYLDHQDGSRLRSLQRGFPAFDLVLRAHYGARTRYPPMFRPWAFGLSNRIIEATADAPAVDRRMRRLLVSYRPMRYPHSVRAYTDRRILDRLGGRLEVYRYDGDTRASPSDPVAEHLWRMTGRRHSPRYYRALRESAVCACFGGYFIPGQPRDERHPVSRLLKRAITSFGLRTQRITQFDSWRFWESLAAGCVSVHLDLHKYGALLPVMPNNWEHYVGLDLDHLERDIERLCGDPGSFERIGAAGRAWSIAAYGPRPTAQRFLTLIGAPVPSAA